MRNQLTRAPEWVRRGFWFLVAGGTGFVLYLVISDGLHYLLHVAAVPSAIAGTLLPVLPTFWMQRRLTFRSDRSKRTALPMYALLQIGNAALVGAMTALGTRLELPGVVVFFFSGVVGALASYIVQAKIVFPAS